MRCTVALLLALGGSACSEGRSTAASPQIAIPTRPAGTAAPPASGGPAGVPELVAFAEQTGGVNASTVTNAMLLDLSFGKEYQAVSQGRVKSQRIPDVGEVGDASVVRSFGRWPDDLWWVEPFVGFTGPEDTAASQVYALSSGRWRKVLQDDHSLYIDIWEAPRGSWLGLKGDGRTLAASSSVLERVVLRGATKPRQLIVSRNRSSLRASRGLPDGGVAAIDQQAMLLFNPGPSEAPTRLVLWDYDGKERALTVPIPARAEQAKLLDLWQQIVIVAEGAVIVAAELSNSLHPAPDRFVEPYAARCDKATCALMQLPEMTEMHAIEAAEDGALLLAGRDAADALSLWALPPKGAWQRLGVAPRGWGAARVIALYGSSAADVWAAVETTAKPPRSALLRSGR